MPNYLVVTGGSRGIGERTADLFQQQGWRTINLSRTPCSLPGVINLSVDLSDTTWPQEVIDSLQAVVKGAEKLCLVHNAALFYSDSIRSLTQKDFQDVLNVSLTSPVALNQMLLPFMRPGSSIIYVGSTLSEQAVSNRASYVISKHAVVGLMRSTGQDLAEEGIHTCCICPGFVNTGMITSHTDKTVLMDFIQSKVIAKRLIEPEEIAEFIYFCALHPIVNGSTMHANLGQITT